jgi:hypothetical protein
VERELFVLSGSQEVYSRKAGGFENRGKLSENEYLASEVCLLVKIDRSASMGQFLSFLSSNRGLVTEARWLTRAARAD